jgi:hypothetical protein
LDPLLVQQRGHEHLQQETPQKPNGQKPNDCQHLQEKPQKPNGWKLSGWQHLQLEKPLKLKGQQQHL